MLKSRTTISALAALAVMAATSTLTYAQDAAPAAPAADAAAAPAAGDQAAKAPPPPPPRGWTVQCANPTGAADGGLICQAEQSLFVMPRRELLVSLVMQIAPETKAPEMLVRVPLGISIADGVSVKVDEGTAQPVTLQTCDPQGCFGKLSVTPEMVDAYGKGTNLNVVFQAFKKEAITIPVPLAGFQAAYQKL
jgi:invasion protein IalB